MRVAIHQPHYFPYAGFFHKLSLADVFVIMDDAQYDKRFTNRNRIIIPNGWTWITVPIKKDCKFGPNYKVEINNELAWRDMHWKMIRHSYSGARFFYLYKDYFESLYKKDWRMLFELDYETTKQVISWLGIKVDIIKESELKVKGQSTQRLVNVCKALGADTYVSGAGGKTYLDEKLFEKENIRLQYQKFRSFPYTQHLSESFIPDLSIIDMLANVGPDSLQLLADQNTESPIKAH
ncbi:MAG TPA: WbqC family protein [Candidatus Nitrosotenuis sp.]|nr:WbqC family protein [Candidatus Nitrosotenuis sp.]